MANFHSLLKKTFVFTQILICIFSAFAGAAYAQANTVDASFNAALSKEAEGGGNFALQPDGKILAFGDFQIVNGTLKNQIARLNADGSLDNSFNCAACDFRIGSVVAQPDGKIYVAGSFFSNVSSTSAARIIRLNADGSLDPTFVSPFTGNAFQINSAVTIWAILSDGRILVSVRSLSNGTIQNSLYQLLPDGSVDTKFEPIHFQTGQEQFETITKVLLLPNEKILVSTASGTTEITGKLRQYNSDGTLDATFASPILLGTDPSNSAFISDFDVQADGTIVIVGKFSFVNSIARMNIARLLPVGAVDLNFNPVGLFLNGDVPSSINILSNGKILVFTGGALPVNFPAGNSKIIRLNPNGTVDDTFTPPANLSKVISYRVNGANEILIAGEFTETGVTSFKYARLSAEGIVNSFLGVNFAVGGSASSLAVQVDGKIIVAGSFTQVNGVPRRNLARLNADGTLDEAFNIGTGFDASVQTVVLDSEGKILVGGNFTTYNGTARKALARLNADGSLDETFNAAIDGGTIYSIALQTDGKIIIGGFFNSINGQTRRSVARLNADGSLDASFNPLIQNDSTIRRVLIQSDGKIVIGGSFTTLGSPSRTNIARLNVNGSVDTSFFVRSISPITLIEIQPDGKYLVMANDLIRLNTDGSTDFAFQTPSFQYPNINNNGVFSILPLNDGTVLLGGSFTAVNGVPRLRIVRLKADGSVEQNFLPGGANNVIRAIVRQIDSKILIGGDFTSVAGVPRLGIARLNVRLIRAPFTRFDFDGDGQADLSVFRPSNGAWYLLNSQTGASAIQFANATDKLVPADYDDDGKADVAAFRDGVWYLQRSTEGFIGVQFGEAGDIPQPADFDGDGRAELVVFRPSSGIWFVYNLATGQASAVQFGVNGDKPVVGDYDGDGKADIAVYRPSNGVWYLQRSTEGFIGTKFGETTDKPVPADYDGDGKSDIAVYRPSNGTWYFIQSQAGASLLRFGIANDIPVPADYDGDGKADVAVYRDGSWYIQKTTAGFTGVQFGDNTDKPIPGAFVF
jgi:uncharacterized delta-60 repeat protein